ncbi:hypothetical protein ACFVHW_24305 [Streptomyces sp. NPDC127110]|uniref:hypothetical protein n=1 Tax=Streptomyces sp. NPDC127110 TaxID=3345362 RepID=UPI0036413261
MPRAYPQPGRRSAVRPAPVLGPVPVAHDEAEALQVAAQFPEFAGRVQSSPGSVTARVELLAVASA